MANYPAIKVNKKSAILGERTTVTLSGTVTDGANLRRVIMAFVYPYFARPAISISNPTTGAWSLEMHASSVDRIIVMALGANSGENTQIFDWVKI